MWLQLEVVGGPVGVDLGRLGAANRPRQKESKPAGTTGRTLPLGSLRQRTTGDLSQQEFLDVSVGTEGATCNCATSVVGGFFPHWLLGNVESGE